jgi:hypothetical protein
MSIQNVASPDFPEIEASVDFFSTQNSTGLFDDLTYQEIILGESLLTPGLQTSVICHSYKNNVPVKNFDTLKNGAVAIRLYNPNFDLYRIPSKPLITQQNVYRLENRNQLDHNNEELTFRACDATMLTNAINLVSKSWKCSTPSSVVDYVLRSCVGARNVEVESSGPARDYIAENIHPFQVIAQQSNVALAGNDPSFLHYMTYENGGTHHFKSLKTLTQQKPVFAFTPSETGSIQGYANPSTILHYTFPCDFDLLSDLLNGIGPNGENITSIILYNEKSKTFSLLGNQTIGCGVGGGPAKLAKTNEKTERQQDACNDGVKNYLLLRQARMSLLENDKIALRMTVPFNPNLNVGKVITAIFPNKQEPRLGNYGTGDYLILHLMHNIKRGGYATTTISCVSKTVGSGMV